MNLSVTATVARVGYAICTWRHMRLALGQTQIAKRKLLPANGVICVDIAGVDNIL